MSLSAEIESKEYMADSHVGLPRIIMKKSILKAVVDVLEELVVCGV